MNIFVHEVRAYIRSSVIWAVVMSILAFIYFQFFIGSLADMQSFLQVFEQLPDTVKQALHLKIERLASLEGFYAMVWTNLALLAGIQATRLGLHIFVKEVREQTVDFLVTKPVRRLRIVSEKFLAVGVLLTISHLIYQVCTWLIVLNLDITVDISQMALISLGLYLTQLVLAGICVLLAIVVPTIKSVTAVSLNLVFGFLLLSVIGSLLQEPFFDYVSIFTYFPGSDIIEHAKFESSSWIASSLLLTITVVTSYCVFRRVDFRG